MWGFGPVLPVGLGLVVPPLVTTFELAFLITLLTVFNFVELLIALIDLGVFNENVPLNIFPTVAGNRRRYLGCAKEGKRGDQRLETTPAVVCPLRQIHFGGQRCPYNGVKISQQWSLSVTVVIHYPSRLIRVQYLFNISDYYKRWSHLYITPSTEYWNYNWEEKLVFSFSSWMLVAQLTCCVCK